MSELWDKLRTSYWFLPLLMTSGAALLAVIARSVDTLVPPDGFGRVLFLYQSDAEQARTLLLAIAGGTLGLVGAVLSITMVPLTIAAAQLGPRLLRTFLRARRPKPLSASFVAHSCTARSWRSASPCLPKVRLFHGSP